ncbi:hypothetical protein HYX03_02740 [Candidatus Woesearchaeota archaeon]|nr:hypothetical protein [Candidatus Woesearchaeota archaeon]
MPFKIKETILGISIAVIFVFFVVFGIKAFYKEPKYENFCKIGVPIDFVSGKGGYYAEPYPARMKEPEQNVCAKSNLEYDKFRKSCAEKKMDVVYEYDDKGCQAAKECTSCNVDFDKARNIYFRNVFIISGIVGIIVIIIGAILNLTSVSAGLFGGGVLTIIYGTTNYWSELADWARFIILGIALAVLIYLGYKGFSMFGFGRGADLSKTKKKK